MAANLIGLYSPAMGSGKTAFATALIGLGYANVKFAGTLKAMIRVLLRDLGYDQKTMGLIVQDYTDGGLKEETLPDLGVSTRYLMQTLGTGWGRKQVKGSIWVDVTKAKIEALLRNGQAVAVDDMRFPNEFQAIKDLGGACIKVIRPGTKDATGHTSEGLLDGFQFDATVTNEGTLDELKGAAQAIHMGLMQRPSAA